MVKSLEKYGINQSNILYQISIAKDGNLFCALLGNNLQEGISGFGETIEESLWELATNLGAYLHG